MYNTTAVINPEVCINLWAYLDEAIFLGWRVEATF